MQTDAGPFELIPFPVASDRLWFDPALVGRNLTFQWSTVTFAGASVVQLAPANPYRWGVGFAAMQAAPSSLFIAPWSDFTVSTGLVIPSNGWLWLKLTDYGPIPAFPWYGSAGGPGSVRVLEVLRQTKG